MKYLIISCSHRKNSESAKVAQYITQSLQSRGHQLHLHDCGVHPLPLWTPEEKGEHWTTWRVLEPELNSADALILITPEWHGMATPQSKNFFLLAGKRLAHKAGLLVSVSAGRGGAYPIAELRQSSYKNTKISWIPEHLIIREVGSVLNGAPSDHELSENLSTGDQWIRDRIDYTLTHLELYSGALTTIREKLPYEDRFSNGM